MRIERIQYAGWNAYRCRRHHAELVVVTGIGPRILQFNAVAGANLLYEDHRNFQVGEWRMYGGHRFSLAPETPLSYSPDNDPCEADAGEDILTIRQQPMSIGLQKTLRIQSAGDQDGFIVHHELENRGESPWSGAIWAITCVPLTGRVQLRRGKSSPTAASSCHFWSNPGQYLANPLSPQWRDADRVFAVEPTGEMAKVGLHSSEGQIQFDHPEARFTLRQLVVPRPEQCPHHGCNLEVYTCRDYMELEILGGIHRLDPGRSMSLTQRWTISAPRAVVPRERQDAMAEPVSDDGKWT